MFKQQLQGGVFLLVGLAILGFAFVGPFSTYQDVQSHENTQATIVSSGMESAEEIDEGETEVEYYPRIDYEYTVDGERYTDSQVFHPSQVNTEPGELEGKEFDTQSQAQDVVDQYGEGETATVYYDDSDPAYSYLRDPSTDLLIASGGIGLFGVLFALIGGGGILGLVSLND